MAVDVIAETVNEAQRRASELLEESEALLYGDFKLASGRVSDYYFDSKKFTLYPAGAHLVAQQLVEKLDDLGIECVGGTAYSAIPIVSQIALFSRMRDGEPIRAFFHRKEAKQHGTKANAEGQFPIDDQPVAIVEDVVTTGDSLIDAIKLAEGNGYRVTHTLVLVDRDEDGGREKVEAAGYKFWALFTVERSVDGVSFVYNGS